MTSSRPAATPGAKMIYPIQRRIKTSRDELIAHWFGNHMAAVIQTQKEQALKRAAYAWRYFATLFRQQAEERPRWDGMAQLWYDAPLALPDEPRGTHPTDTFQEKVEPYMPWATREFVVLDGAERLPIVPPTLNPPFPCTRSGFFKVTFFVVGKAGIDNEAFFDHWLDAHAPNVAETMTQVGGFRYVVSQSRDLATAPYAGVAELYFPNADGWANYRATIKEDGMGEFVDREAMPIFTSDTEMVGIP